MMKIKILSIMLLAFTTIKAQVPTDQVASYNFTGGSLVNEANPGIGNLTGGNSTSYYRADRFSVEDNAMRIGGIEREGYTLTPGFNYSVCFWFRGGGPSGTSQRIFEVLDTYDQGFYLQNDQGNVLRAGFKNTAVTRTGSQSLATLFDSTWHHIALTISHDSTNGYTNNVYIDGVHNSTISTAISTTNTASILYNNSTFTLSPSSLQFYDQVDDINIYERALSATEVANCVNASSIAPVTTVYVDVNATGNNNGTSWNDAYTDLQSALSSAYGSSASVWVAKGTYKPSTSNTSTSFMASANVYGGFDGSETDLSDRDMSLIHTTNATILSGDLLGDDTALVDYNNTTRSDNSKHVLTISNESLQIDGLTIQDGHADGTSGNDRYGGGVFKLQDVGTTTIKNCILKNNLSLTSSAAVYLTVDDDSNITIDACIIEGNLAPYAAGFDFHLNGRNSDMNISITNSLFKNNKTANTGSTVGLGSAAFRLRSFWDGAVLNATITNNTFVNNSNLGSSTITDYPVVGISKTNGTFGDVKIANNIFWGNTTNSGVIAKAVGKTSDLNDRLNGANVIVKNNIDEDGLSLLVAYAISTSTLDPLFTDAANDDYTLQSISPAIDAGDNTYATTAGDLLNNARIFNTTVDMGVYEFGSTTLGTDDIELNANSLVIYPNPTTSFINLTGVAIESVIIYNTLGQQIIATDATKINVANLISGIYIVQIKTANNIIQTKRFVKL